MKNKFKPIYIVTAFLIGVLLLAACGGANSNTPEPQNEVDMPSNESQDATDVPTPGDDPSPTTDLDTFHPLSLEIVTLLPKDAIPAIDNPTFLTPEEADEEYVPDELVIGVEYNGDARAYSISFLSRHEIVNDTVGGRKIAVTW